MDRLCWVVVLLSLTLLGCAQAPEKSPFTGFYKGYDSCRQEFAAADARIAGAGVGNAEYFRPPGFPYLRTDRMLASLRGELADRDAIWEWQRRMRELDRELREYELYNLNLNDYDRAVLRDRLADCGRVLADVELKNDRNWERLMRVVQPDDDYSTVARILGLHALTAAARTPRLRAERDAWVEAYRAPLPAQTAATSRIWTARPTEDFLETAASDAVEVNVLGFPGLIGSGWRALAYAHAPRLRIEGTDGHDVPSRLRYGGAVLEADTSLPAVYYHLGYTRFGGQTLIQVSYYVWFAAPDETRTGPVDGFVWRVTFDPSLRPLVYDSAHGSGRDHRWYPVQALDARRSGADVEPQFIAPTMAPESAATLLLASGSHAVRRVVPEAQAQHAAAGEYELLPYEELYSLETATGSRRSVFGPNGVVRGSQGRDPMMGFSSGVADAGALRQIGHMPIANKGKRHWDDPDLLGWAFVDPVWPKRAVPESSGQGQARLPQPDAAAFIVGKPAGSSR
ncbi:hypothetical protein [Hydrocarboniphaga effusa]|jgi:hypothetical protein|uniref:Uncharacterized protein n=1 Tax=Hydrocarboniphaga effusa AP103 TaxID=1172194 RepID=I7ZF34_9GAMM|nr:hypothetical protein [Hydrocarboniphaga effusa]EIT70489.1 hypothetical protein WQQ_06260 [Hydrocarboniphaga effusa AP103]